MGQQNNIITNPLMSHRPISFYSFFPPIIYEKAVSLGGHVSPSKSTPLSLVCDL